ncbi:iron-containing alcohol dehydrogenase [Halalkalibacter alkaliphilus]|uniref:Iron-containing alcohol dehydrogenase n=1 Tax=Halalkalibacter alkaliphilus TaxID=2917993 RepID=A0A9X2CWG9_9BACI|nr:iron-containing alcohol dehydrogenase [Halalkalibacter alkaliphilus]MCL7749621.1 iron-containing alcohol dehydrogenase [Halalkalibacter alkaliphilus]
MDITSVNYFSEFNCNTEIIMGNHSVQKVSEIIKNGGFSHALVVCDEGIEKAGILDVILQQLNKAYIQGTVFSSVEANPSTLTVEACYKVLQESNADIIIGVGGGSSLDVAKAVSILGTNGGEITDYEGINKVPKRGMPLIAIPTTAGTASEITIFTVITDHDREYKFTVGSRDLSARWAIIDPVLTLSLPPGLTASTGLDALVHAIESYISKKAFMISEVLALKAIELISSSLRTAVHSGDDLNARYNMLYGSLIAGLAFNNTRLGNVHAMSHPLSAKYNVPHGIANSILLPHVMEFNRVANPKKFSDIAIAMGAVSTDEGTELSRSFEAINAVKHLSNDIGIPATFEGYNISEQSINEMANDAMESGNILVNPRKTTKQDLINLFLKCTPTQSIKLPVSN